MKRYIGKVIDNNDPDLEGKCQIYVEHLMSGFQPSQYQWFKQDREFTSNIPEINDLVWAYFEDELASRQGYYQNKVTLKSLHEHNETIGSITGAYPDVKYIQLKNGVSIALNSNQTEVSIIAGTAEIYIDPTGLISIKNGVTTLKTLIDALIDILLALDTTGSPTSHVTGPGAIAKLNAEKIKWAQFLK